VHYKDRANVPSPSLLTTINFGLQHISSRQHNSLISWTKSEFHSLEFRNTMIEYTHPDYKCSSTFKVLLPQEDTRNGNFNGLLRKAK
jgi:hypothetical protein